MTVRPSEGRFKRWRKWRKARRDARQLIKEARRILKRHSHRVKDEVAVEVRQAIDGLREAMAGSRFSVLRDRLDKLDELVDKHLAFGRKSALREYTESIGIAVLIALLLRAFVVEAFKIPSGSMIPTLEVGDHIFVNKFIYGLRLPFTNIQFVTFKKPRRGGVIVFVYPEDESKDFIKRIVGVEGDTVEIKDDGRVFVNGRPINRRQLPGPCVYADSDENSDHWEPKPCVAYVEQQGDIRYQVIHDLTRSNLPPPPPTRIPKGHVFVMGDNRDNSHDSRFWGTVPLSYIKGRAIIVWWSYGDPEGVRWRRFFHWVHATPRLRAPNVETVPST